MIKCTILIPTTYNCGEAVKGWILNGFLNDIRLLVGAYTLDGESQGVWTSPNGRHYNDRLLKLWVVCDIAQLSRLRDITAIIARDLQQETVYFEWHEVNVEFVKPA